MRLRGNWRGAQNEVQNSKRHRMRASSRERLMKVEARQHGTSRRVPPECLEELYVGSVYWTCGAKDGGKDS